MSSFAHWRVFEGPPPGRELRDFSDRDLLVLILRSPALADRVLRWFSVEALRNRTVGHLVGVGLRRERAEQLLAAVELGKRAYLRDPWRADAPIVRNADDAARLLRSRLSGLDHEEAHVLLLDGAGRLIESRMVGRGGIHATPVPLRDVLAPALDARAASVLLAHNHPSGNPEPSPTDVLLTHQLALLAQLLGVRLLDHVVLAGDRHVSLAERDLLQPRSGNGRPVHVGTLVDQVLRRLEARRHRAAT